jgi:hypothetical protein
MQNVKNVKLPSAGVITGVVQTVVFGGGATYGLYNSLFNVEGGHRAIVYNRVLGIKDKVRSRDAMCVWGIHGLTDTIRECNVCAMSSTVTRHSCMLRVHVDRWGPGVREAGSSSNAIVGRSRKRAGAISQVPTRLRSRRRETRTVPPRPAINTRVLSTRSKP